ncbi:hypothetical protein JM16_009670 [Phytophthora kernoviae]|uniref:Chromo domain-containing protein n=1 Tax=Phytophthora kernoviae TaxID=325452 RepID=A0A8T0LKQ1_9STRA|nr:hypothetical protein JM16_009670 [Phytophthora kernoviae]
MDVNRDVAIVNKEASTSSDASGESNAVVSGCGEGEGSVAANAMIVLQSQGDLRIIREQWKRPAEEYVNSNGLAEQEDEDDPVDNICEILRIVERKDETIDGETVRLYRVRWKDVKPGERALNWVTEADVEGAPAWKSAVDRYYNEALPMNPGLLFTHFIEQNFEAITMSNSIDSKCVYVAVAKIMELQGSEMCLTTELITDFETQEGFSRVQQHGLRADQIQRFFEFLVVRGWKNQIFSNQYRGGRTGPAGLALAAGNPGVYFVETLEPPRIGHCIVLEITKDRLCFIYEGGSKINLGKYHYAEQIRWVRECRPTLAEGIVQEIGLLQAGEPEQASTVLLASHPKKSRRKRAKKSAAKVAVAELVDSDD